MTIYNEESRAKLSEKFPVKTREQKREGGTIENWSLVPFFGDETKLVVVGTPCTTTANGVPVVRFVLRSF